MKNTLLWLLFIGDLAIIALFAFFRVFSSSNPPRPFFDLGVTVGPFLLAWLSVSVAIRAFDYQIPAGRFIKRSAIAWLIAGTTAQISRMIILDLITQTTLFVLPLVLNLIEGAVLFIGWRAAFWWIQHITTTPSRAILKRTIWSSLIAISGVAIICVALFFYIAVKYSRQIYITDNVPPRPVAIVFGAGVWLDGTPSQLMEERVRTAYNLFRIGKVQKLLLSGDKMETKAMLQLALKFGIQKEALVLDDGGDRTYASCYRAKTIYSVSQAVVISQRFHLFRALFTCNSLGIEPVGVVADSETPLSLELQAEWYLREILATTLAWWEVNAVRFMQ